MSETWEPECRHHSVMRAGEIRCRDCGATYKLLIGWSGWVPKRTKAECGKMGGRPRKAAA